ncbi:hypothetical protein BD560DRAFT_446290 [Blakeslea trispora]|nr:hypothetical protein BD560DRAFT_446290 [Blakeslea trispora]
MLRQLNNLSKFTTSSLKYAANNTAAVLISLSASSKDDPALPSPQLLAYWISETQRGLDAFFNDDFNLATTIFLQHHQESPFHAVGYALIAYVEAMLGFESEKIQIALDRIAAAEALARQFSKKARRRVWHTNKSKKQQKHPSDQEDPITFVFFDYPPTSRPSSPRPSSPEIPYELLATNCMLMAATIQFLRNSWIDYMKAAYKLRKAYKIYEQMFETTTGQKASEYAHQLKKTDPTKQRRSSHSSISSTFSSSPPSHTSSWTDKRNSLLHTTSDTMDVPTTRVPSPLLADTLTKRRPISSNGNPIELIETSYVLIDTTVESGIFFGIGLFSLIFSLLPPRVNKILNTLGFHSSRPFALHLLLKSFKSHGLYSSLSALSLLAYYTNLSLFVHPKLLPKSLSLETARHILDQMKITFPQGKIWKLLEGKLCKMEGKTRRGVEILRDARRRENARVDLVISSSSYHYQQQKATKKKSGSVSGCSELAQLQALAVYEMGWGQIFLGDYFQAAETFFRLESMNNWSRAFYHYIATCCMFADEEYEKSALEFMQIPSILRRKRQLGGRLLPNEIFAERKIKHWRSKNKGQDLNGESLKQIVIVHPLWELVYLWNGFSQLDQDILMMMKQTMEDTVTNVPKQDIGVDLALLYLLLGVSVRELGDIDLADLYLRQAILAEDRASEDCWVIPHALYEMACLCCFQMMQPSLSKQDQKKLSRESREWITKSEKHLQHRQQQQQQQEQQQPNDHLYEPSVTSDNTGDSDWDSRLHVRCQLLIEKLEDFFC